MENTEKVLFEDDTKPQWYIAVGERWIGPLAAGDVYEKILAQEITWAHFVWKSGQTDWRRICEVPTFQAAVPGKPEKEVQVEVKAAAAPISQQKGRIAAARKVVPGAAVDQPSRREWFLYYNDSQFGPFSEDEVNRFLKIGKLHGRIHAWRDGMEKWDRLERISCFADAVIASKTVREQKRVEQSPREQRSAPRRPLVARIVLAHEDGVVVAVCRDISVGGMQVLTDRIPGKAGAKLKLNVSPPGDERGGNIKPFVAEGVIVRILEDGRGFSFRFDRLPESAKQAIEDYIQFSSR